MSFVLTYFILSVPLNKKVPWKSIKICQLILEIFNFENKQNARYYYLIYSFPKPHTKKSRSFVSVHFRNKGVTLIVYVCSPLVYKSILLCVASLFTLSVNPWTIQLNSTHCFLFKALNVNFETDILLIYSMSM